MDKQYFEDNYLKESFNIQEMLYLIQEYIQEKKGQKVTIKDPNPFQLLDIAFSTSIEYFKRKFSIVQVQVLDMNKVQKHLKIIK